jgi:hypothetical protein
MATIFCAIHHQGVLTFFVCFTAVLCSSLIVTCSNSSINRSSINKVPMEGGQGQSMMPMCAQGGQGTVCCDVVQELATAAIEKMNLKIMLLNNQHLGMVVQWEDRFYKVSNKQAGFRESVKGVQSRV